MMLVGEHSKAGGADVMRASPLRFYLFGKLTAQRYWEGHCNLTKVIAPWIPSVMSRLV